MQNSYFKVAAAVFSAGTLLKISALAVALAMLGAWAMSTGSSHYSSQGGVLDPPTSKATPTHGAAIEDGFQCSVWYCFYTLDRNSKPVELFVDPTSGDVVGQL